MACSSCTTAWAARSGAPTASRNFRIGGRVKQQRATVFLRPLTLSAHPEFLQPALAGNVVEASDRHDSVETNDIESEGKDGAAELGPVAHALRLRREGET